MLASGPGWRRRHGSGPGIASFGRSEVSADLLAHASRRRHPIHLNATLVLDTDSVFHGVEPVGDLAVADPHP